MNIFLKILLRKIILFELLENIKVEKDKTIDLVLPAEYTVSLNIMNNVGITLDSGDVFISRNKKEINADVNEGGKAFFTVPPGTYNIKVLSDEKVIAFQEINIGSEKTIDIITEHASFIHLFVLLFTVFLAISIIVFMFFKKKINFGLKLLVVALLILSIFQPWWILTGEENSVKTSTTTMLYPPKMVTLTSNMDAVGGSVSILPDDFTTVMVLLSALVTFSIVFILVNLFLKERFNKTKKAFIFVSLTLMILCIGLFYYAMSMVAEIGVGSFMGSGDISISIPGQTQGIIIACSWGPGIGFILLIFSLIILLSSIFINKKFDQKFTK